MHNGDDVIISGKLPLTKGKLLLVKGNSRVHMTPIHCDKVTYTLKLARETFNKQQFDVTDDLIIVVHRERCYRNSAYN